MPTSAKDKSLSDLRLDLLWGAWAELGVPGWVRTHGAWAIDPEPLILHTAGLDDEDPRLRDESTDWSIRYWRFVSRVRLRNLLKEENRSIRSKFGEFAATVSEHAGVNWPNGTDPRPFRVTGRSTLPSLAEPSLIWVRLRAMFGLGARTEILRYFLSREGGAASVATMAALTGYAKRNIAEECETLEKAGVLAVRQVANRFYFSLAKRKELSTFVGESPDVFPLWTSLLRVVDALVDLEEKTGEVSERVLAVEAKKTLDQIEDDLDALGVPMPTEPARGSSIWPAMQNWSYDLLSDWAAGRWLAQDEAEDEQQRVVSHIARRKTVRRPATSDR